MSNPDYPAALTPATLPIRDHAALRAAIAYSDISPLLMVYTHFAKDEEFLDRLAPYISSIFEQHKEAPQELVAELHDRVFELLTRSPPPQDIPPSDTLMRKMLSICVGEPVGEEFIPMLQEQMGFSPPEMRSERKHRQAPPDDFKVLVIGAGLTGLLAAVKLQEAGYNFEVIEKNPEVGGTWWENTYPGCAVDTPSHFYSYSFELNPDWSHYTPNGPEFQRYLLGIAERYELRSRVVFNTRVQACVFDEARSLWQVTVEDASGKRVIEANAVINAHGPLNRWKLPDIKGLSEFKGKVLHTAAWDNAVPLAGKRVALLGTGASGVQLGSAIAGQVAHLTVLQRSRHWLMPNYYIEVSEPVRWAQRYIPHYAPWLRFRAFWFAADGLFDNIRIDPDWPHQDRSISAMNDATRDYCLQNYHSKLANRPDLLEKLLPNYPVFGKRIVMDINWLDTLCRDNVSLEDCRIDHVDATAIVLADGRRIEVDVIACATGFDTQNMVGSMDIVGRGGRKLREEWRDDPRAYLGVSVPGYPNFFLTVGPNSAPNHAGGQNITSESQIHYILECLELIRSNGAATIEASATACERFNAEVEQALQGLIWLHPTAPHSYYKNARGRNIMSCPYRLVDYWWMTRTPKLEDLELGFAQAQQRSSAGNVKVGT
jgi:4-hydroxyacetophenone monooxygenase